MAYILKHAYTFVSSKDFIKVAIICQEGTYNLETHEPSSLLTIPSPMHDQCELFDYSS